MIKASAGWDVIIGVWKTKYPKRIAQALWGKQAKDKYYGWNVPYPELTSGDSDQTNKPFGVACQTEDTVEMILDLSKSQIMYNVNGKSQGIAFEEIDKCEYIVAMNLEYNTDSIKLLSYEACDVLQDQLPQANEE